MSGTDASTDVGAETDTRALALAWLAGEGGVATLGRLTDAVGGLGGRLSGRVELVSTLETLESEGLVELLTAEAGVRCRLTDAGQRRGETARERLRTATVEVVDGDGRERLSVAAAADRLDRSPVAVAAAATDGVYATETPDWTLVGRDAELDRARRTRATVRAGTGRALLLTGPPGVGKTALAERVLDECAAFEVARGRATGEGAAYGPLRDALAAVQPAADPFATAGPTVDGRESWEAAVETGAAVADADAGDGGDRARTRQAALFADVTAALAPDPGEPPRVLFLDDLHLADDGTLSYLGHLLDRLADHRLLVVGAYRPTELPEDAALPPATAPPDGVTRLGLSPLARAPTRRLVEGTLETRDPPASFVDAVHERTGGTPLFVEETVAALAETGQVDPTLGVYPDSPGAIDVPAAVEDTIEHRVAQYPAPARELLRWAAVLGDGFDVETLLAVTDLSATSVRTYLDALVDGGVFVREDDRLAFRSEVVQEAVLADLDDAERRRRHGRVAAALAADDGAGAETAAALATHHERAGDRERAVAAYRRAADHAREVYAHETAVEHLRSALALARETEPGATVEVALALSELYGRTADHDRAERFARFARETATTPARRARALARLASTAESAGDGERALELVEAGLAVDSDAATTHLLEVRATAQRKLGRYESARETARRGRRLAAAREEPVREVAALTTLAVVARRQGDLERAREHYRTCLDHGRETGQRLFVATARLGLGDVAHRRGDLDGATEQLTAALSLTREIGDRRGEGNCLNSLGLLAADRGDHERAREYYRQRLELARAVGDDRGAATTLNNLGQVAHRQGELARAREHLTEALSVSRAVGATHGVARCLANLGTVAVDRGDGERAAERFRAAVETFETVGDAAGAASVSLRLGELADPERDPAVTDADRVDARERYRTALRTASEAGERRVVSVAMLRLAALAFGAGDRREAFTVGDRALDRVDARHLVGDRDVLGDLRRLVEAAETAGHEARAHEWAHRVADALEATPVDSPEWLAARTTGRLEG